MPPRCQNRKIRSGSVTLLRLSFFSMRNIQKIHAPIGKIFPEKHCHFSGFRIYWEVYGSFLPAPQAGELSSCIAASGGKQAGKAILPSPPAFLLFFYSAGIRIFSVGIAPYFRSPGSAIVPVPALSALLSNRLLHFSGFFDRPDIPPFPTLSSAWIPPFPGAAIISAPASFRCRSYAGIFSFPESIAVRRLEVFSLPVFRFWISERAAFIPLGFCAVVFRSASAGFVQLLPHFLTLERPGFCPAFVQHWTPFCPAAGGASLIEPLWEASYPPVSIRRGSSVFYPSPK